MGKFNSSATRIRPFFEALLRRDPTGSDWLPALLSPVGAQTALSEDLLNDPGEITQIVFQTETRSEKAIGPPEAFCRWLLQNPDRMVWPRGTAGKFSPDTNRWRRDLMGLAENGPIGKQKQAIAAGLEQLALKGVKGSSMKWWAFEGRTKVDCYIETERLRLYVEGKRTEALSSATAWYPARNQFVRNLEAAREHAGDVPFACIMMSESPICVNQAQLDAGLPHLAPHERVGLLRRYLGNVTWGRACALTKVSFAELPDTCA